MAASAKFNSAAAGKCLPRYLGPLKFLVLKTEAGKIDCRRVPSLLRRPFHGTTAEVGPS